MHSLLLGLFAFSALVSSSILPATCSFERAEDVAAYISCGDQLSIVRCLSQWNGVEHVEDCLKEAGCSEMEAATAAEMVRDNCASDGSGEDLRKRQKNSASSKGKTTAAPKTTDTPTTTSDDSTSAAATTTDESTTSDQSSTSAAAPSSSTGSSAAPSTTPKSSTMASTSASTSTTGTSSAPLVCQTTSQLSTSWCMTSTNGAGSTATTCIPTTTPIIGCGPGLICQTQDDNLITCMVRQDNLTVSGLVVSIFFGAIILGFIAALCTMCYKNDRLSRNAARQREAAMIASSQAKNMRDVDSSNNYMRGRGADAAAAASEAHLPLMAAQGPAGGSMRDRSADYGGARPTAHRVPSGSYQEVVASRTPPGAPKLHPGLMGMSGEEDDMGYGRGRQ